MISHNRLKQTDLRSPASGWNGKADQIDELFQITADSPSDRLNKLVEQHPTATMLVFAALGGMIAWLISRQR